MPEETMPSEFAPGGLWELMRPRLALYLESFSGLDRDDREDVLQAVSINLWRNAGRVLAAPERWLYRAARNGAIDALRRKSREDTRRDHALVQGDWGIDCARSALPGPEEIAMSREEIDFVKVFLEALADSDREILHLAFAEGMSYKDIGTLLEIPIGTIKWRMARLKQRLALAYRKEFG